MKHFIRSVIFVLFSVNAICTAGCSDGPTTASDEYQIGENGDPMDPNEMTVEGIDADSLDPNATPGDPAGAGQVVDPAGGVIP